MSGIEFNSKIPGGYPTEEPSPAKPNGSPQVSDPVPVGQPANDTVPTGQQADSVLFEMFQEILFPQGLYIEHSEPVAGDETSQPAEETTPNEQPIDNKYEQNMAIIESYLEMNPDAREGYERVVAAFNKEFGEEIFKYVVAEHPLVVFDFMQLSEQDLEQEMANLKRPLEPLDEERHLVHIDFKESYHFGQNGLIVSERPPMMDHMVNIPEKSYRHEIKMFNEPADPRDVANYAEPTKPEIVKDPIPQSAEPPSLRERIKSFLQPKNGVQ